jgi:hypothetical protein
VAAAAAGASGTAAAAARAPAAESSIEGTWLVEFRVADSPPDRPTTPLRIALLGGGSVVAQVGPVSRNPDGSLNYLSLGLGSWASSGDGYQFNYLYNRLLDQATRTLVATTWVALTRADGGGGWSGVWRRRDLDASGGLAFETGGTVRASRETVEPL